MSEETTESKPEEETEDKLYLGKFKTPEDMESAYSSLESKFGEQGNEIGALKAERNFLMNQANQPAPKEDKLPDYDIELEEIAKQMDEGDISRGEGMKLYGDIQAKKSAAATAVSLQMQQDQNIIDASRSNFLGQHEDFESVRNSGSLERIKDELPGFHDDVSAFYEYKARESASAYQAELETAKTESFEAGKAEMAKVAGGAQDTQKVLQTPGGESAKEIGRENVPKTKLELEESGLTALRKAREG